MSLSNQRLIVFGPSSSLGLGLENPEKEVWGRILSGNLKREFVNNSIAGASNKLICYNTTTFNFLPTDLVILAWAFVDRYSVIESDKGYINFMPSDTDERSLSYYRFVHNDFDHIFMSKVYINYTIDFLRKKKIEFYSLFNHKADSDLTYDSKNKIPFVSGDYFINYPLSQDGIHVGAEGHKALGEELTRFFKRDVL